MMIVMPMMPVVMGGLALVSGVLRSVRMFISRVAGSLRTMIHNQDDGAVAPILQPTRKTAFGHEAFALKPVYLWTEAKDLCPS